MFGGAEGAHGHEARPGLKRRGVQELNDRRRLLAAVEEFRRRVEEEVPGLYCWFDAGSLHVTLRALIN
jgi:hypothetical protein